MTDHNKIMVLCDDHGGVVGRNELLETLLQLAGCQDGEGIKNTLKTAIPEYCPYKKNETAGKDHFKTDELLN
ncbi:MAG: hypothetical protein IH612_04320 [Desulfofustis sp.]|nr:hypothetical protein [Desulfofustis sp.]